MCAQVESSWAWAPCGCGGAWGLWALYCAYGSRAHLVEHHYGTGSPYQSPPGTAACDRFDSEVVGVGGGARQLQQSGRPFGGLVRFWEGEFL